MLVLLLTVSKDLDISEICKITGLSREEIEQI